MEKSNILFLGTVLGVIYFVVLFIYTLKMINRYGGELRDHVDFKKSDKAAINMVTKFGDSSSYGPNITNTNKAVELLEEIEGKLTLYFRLYIAGSIIFFGFLFSSIFVLPFTADKNQKKGENSPKFSFFGVIIAACLITIIIFAIIYMKNIKKGMDDIPSFIDNEIRRNNNNNTSS